MHTESDSPLSLLSLMSRMHVFWYRLTGGRVGGRVKGARVLLLATTGRKSGREHTTPLLYLEDGENLIIVASFGGRNRNPAWYKNLRQNPVARVEVKGLKRMMSAEVASAEEKARLWPLLTAMYPQYDSYQHKTTREIPVVILHQAE